MGSHLTTRTYLALTLGLLFVSLSVVVVLLANSTMKQLALHDAERAARMLLDHNLAIHMYFTKDLKPKLFEQLGPVTSKEYFEPAWMSSTYAIRHMDKYFQHLSESRYYYKESAINARSPENEADAYEKAFLIDLQKDPQLTTKSAIRILDGKPYFTVLRRGEEMEESCLRCHSVPEKAPGDMVKQYGPERSFHRKLDEVVQAISIRIPLAEAFSSATTFTYVLSSLLLAALGSGFLIVWVGNKRLIIDPIASIREHAVRIATKPESLGETIHEPKATELRDLVAAFNQMSVALKASYDELEQRVGRRTYELAMERERLQVTLRSIGDGVISTDTEGRVTALNRQAEVLTGWTEAEALGRPVQEVFVIVSEETRAPCESPVAKVLKTGQIVDLANNTILIARDGTERILADSGAPIQDEDGNVFGVVLVFRDVTDHVRSEQALKKSQELQMSILDSMPGGVYIVNNRYQIEYVNPIIESTFGPISNRLCYQYFHDRSEPCPWCQNARVFQGESVQWEWHSEKIGKTYELFDTPLKNDDGSISKLEFFHDITDRKQAEQSLALSESRYRNLVMNSPDAIFVNHEDKVILVNNACLNLFGANTEAELIGKSPYDLFHPDFHDIVRARIHKLRQSGEPVPSIEEKIVRVDGRVVDVEVLAAPFSYGDTEAIHVILRDITQRKEAEKQIRMNEARLQCLYDIGQYRATSTHDLLDFALNAAIKLTGSKVGFICRYDEGKRLFELSSWSKEVTKQCEVAKPQRLYELDKTGIWGEAVRQRKPIIVNDFQASHHLKRGYPQGHVEVHNFMIIPVFSGNRIVAVVGMGNKDSDYEDSDVRQLAVFMDAVWRIADSKRVEAVERRLVTAVEQAVEGIVITDTQGNIEYVNPGYEKITGYSMKDVVGQKHSLFRNREEDSPKRRAIVETISRGERWTGHLVKKRKDGGTYEEEVTVTPVQDSHGGVANYVVVKRDVTNEASLQRQLLQAQKMEAIGTLAGGVAHDFNNILQVGLGYSELLLGDESLPKHCLSDVRKVHESAKRGADLVQRLLTFSRKTEINPQPLNLNRRITELRKMLERTVPKMIDIRLVLDKGLATINADPTQIDQILMNLAVNARDAMPDGGNLTIATANVVLDEEYAKQHLEAGLGLHVVLTVTDTGTGMDGETLEHIFEPFYTTKTVGEGTGLGLAMVHGIVKHHGGHIRCYSEPGYGTTFRLYFPALPAEEEPEAAIVRAMPKGGTETILLVDDEEFIRELGSRILTKVGYKVITASNGKEALEVYTMRRIEIDLVILDLIMPEMGGRQCLEGLLNMDPSVKVVIASGYSTDALSKEALVSAAKGFVSKPYEIGRVLGVVRDVLDSE